MQICALYGKNGIYGGGGYQKPQDIVHFLDFAIGDLLTH